MASVEIYRFIIFKEFIKETQILLPLKKPWKDSFICQVVPSAPPVQIAKDWYTELFLKQNFQILSLGRNAIKHLQGIEAAAESLEQLWVSYNQVKNTIKFCKNIHP